MPDFEGLYYRLFATIADAVELLEQGQGEQARERLISAMQDAEERFLQESE
ncbi:MAG: hypothetical protein J6K84_05960 [Oscillospiraceae bacterium]|nr:hypothetical protein [Oscillospiraceae bacterium]